MTDTALRPAIYSQSAEEIDNVAAGSLEEFESASGITEALTDQLMVRQLAAISQRFDALHFGSMIMNMSVIYKDDPQRIVSQAVVYTRFTNALYASVKLMKMGLLKEAYGCLISALEAHALFALTKIDRAFADQMMTTEQLYSYSRILDHLNEFGFSEPAAAQTIKTSAIAWGDNRAFSVETPDDKSVHLLVGGSRDTDAKDRFVKAALSLADDFILLSTGESFGSHENRRRGMLAKMYSMPFEEGC